MKSVILIAVTLIVAAAAIPLTNNGKNKFTKSKLLTFKDVLANMKRGEEGGPLWEVDLAPWWDSFFVGYKQVMEFNGGNDISLANLTYAFERDWLGVTWKGSFGWYDGHLKGMETLHRVGPASLVINSITDEPTMGDDVSLKFNGDVGVDFLSGSYYGLVNWMNVNADADILLNINQFEIDFLAKFQTDCTFVLEKLEVNPGRIDVTVENVPFPLNTIIESVATVGVNLFKVGFVEGVEVFVREFLLKHLLSDLANSFCESEPTPCGTSKNISMTVPKFY